MPMNPIETTRKIKGDYENYLQSILKVKDAEITKSTYKALKSHRFVKGPYLEATLPYVSGGTLRDLMKEGIASSEFGSMSHSIDLDRPLYTHQEKAFRKVATDHRNIIVATGTGSGKTESFLYPILNSLLREKEQGTLSPGVRALLLYPMNALANDQMKRLRELLETYPDITFGRYTGETIEKEAYAVDTYKKKKEEEIRSNNPYAVQGKDYHLKDLMPLENERLSREKMRENPPHILLTNYAMLEYLLIRPSDNVFFDGPDADKWQFIVLDEAHTYKGATGTEIALLLRRLKQRVVHNQRGKIQCMATSATLGNKEALPDLAKFASDIFDEEFTVSDIITSERKKIDILEMKVKGTLEDYKSYKEKAGTMDQEEAGKFLYSKLSIDLRIGEVIRALEAKPKALDKVADLVFQDIEEESKRLEGMILLIELGVLAKKDRDSAALLPARYHLFVKALEGVYIALYPNRRTFLDRKELDEVQGKEVPVFELANCQNCGQEYLVGVSKQNKLKPAKMDEKAEYYLLTNEEVSSDLEYDDDETAFAEANVKNMEEYELCTACGTLHRANLKQRPRCCEVADQGKLVKVYKMISKKHVPNTCTSCGAVSNSIIKRFMTANQPATYVVASSLYSMIPPEKAEVKKRVAEEEFFFDEEFLFGSQSQEESEESGRKLLVFSDNRQEAAFFAAYMDNKYNQLMWRRLILRELRDLGREEEIQDLMLKLKRPAEDLGLFKGLKNPTSGEKDQIIQTFVMKELLAFERNQGLEGSGYVRFSPELPPRFPGYKDILTGEEMKSVFSVMLDTLRLGGAMSFPGILDPSDDVFAPRNRSVYFNRYDGGSTVDGTIMSFVPKTGHRNRRLDYLLKLLLKKGYSEEEAKEISAEMLVKICDLLDGPLASRLLSTKNKGAAGTVHQLSYKNWRIEYLKDQDHIYKCGKCGKIAHVNVLDICPEFRCSGSLISISAEEYRNDPYYKEIYQNQKVIPMISKEHTAQLNKERAGELQKEFESGKVNVLSCSTTFEMGVDVGQLEAILLRNVPPETANYVQRAGRAGRRTSSTAFSVTYARRSSHDLHYFANPQEIISGKIKSPYIELTNEKIADRHLNSIVMAWFFKDHPHFFNGKVSQLIGYQEEQEAGIDVVAVLKEELLKKPEELLMIIKEALGETLCKKLEVQEWSFINRLVGEDGVLTNAILEKKSDIEMLSEIKDRNYKEGKKTDAIQRTIHTFLSESVLSFLASSGVLPKYGFPVDVVKLDILNDRDTSVDVDLSRDLKLAIAEYAPGSEIIAAGKIWTSHALNKVRGKEWPSYRYYECTHCRRVEIPEDNTIAVSEEEEEEKICSMCNHPLKPKKFYVPIFGFSTMYGEKPKNVGETRPERYYSTKIQFGGFGHLDAFEEVERKEDLITIGGNEIHTLYSPQGKLVVLNRGKNNTGLAVCSLCGFATDYTKPFPHKNKFGRDCPNGFATNAALGHMFLSDVLKLRFPNKVIDATSYEDGKDKWSTLLYAILEGASDVLGISRSDINGCVDWSDGYPVLILFDEASGGAGHVKRIHQNLESVLKGAFKRVDGHCGCGKETTCYGCLRSYGNQMEHDVLARGLAKSYLEWLLSSQHSDVSQKQKEVPEEKKLTKEWEETLDLLTSDFYDLAWDMVKEGTINAPDEVGYPLVSEETGVMGYEAEMIWHDKKVAVLPQEATPECRNAFKESGWNIFVVNEMDKDHLLKELKARSGGKKW